MGNSNSQVVEAAQEQACACDVEDCAYEHLPCGCEDNCQHTIVIHDQHIGYLENGQLFCRGQDSLIHECSIPLIATQTPCKRQPASSHVHGPNCGHEAIPHGSHVDYLVGNRLEHVVRNALCCDQGCHSPSHHPFVVDHGTVAIQERQQPKALVVGGSCDPLPSLQGVAEAVVAKGADVGSTSIFVNGICCPAEVPVVQNTLARLPGILEVEVVVVTKTVKVKHDVNKISPAAVVAALNGAHLDAYLGDRGGRKEMHGKLKFPPKSVIMSSVLLAVSLLHYIGGRWENLQYVAAASVAFGAPPIFFKAFNAVRHLKADMNVLMAIAIIGAIAIQEYVEAAVIAVLFGVSVWLENKCLGAAQSAIQSIMELQPEKTTLAATGEEVDVSSVKKDAIILVKPGDRIPIDGVVTKGASVVDESMLTGESQPVEKQRGNKVVSGTLNDGISPLVIRCTTSAANSAAARLAQLVQTASAQRTRREQLVTTFARWFTPLVLLICALIILVPLAIGLGDMKKWVNFSLVLLVTGCPCALVLSTPVTVVSALSRAAHQGIVFKGGEHLETLGSLQAISFDKTGTLTEGHCRVAHTYLEEGLGWQDVLRYSVPLQTQSSHPLAAAIVGHAAGQGVAGYADVGDVFNVQGEGIYGVVNGSHVALGNAKLMDRFNATSHGMQMEDAIRTWENEGSSIVHIAINHRRIGFFAIQDTLRPSVPTMFQHLSQLGLYTAMITGDNEIAAKSIARQAGMDEGAVYASCSPQDKINIVHKIKESHKVIAHVGDGVNDGAALAGASVGIAMGTGGSAVAMKAADIAIFSSNMESLVFATKLGREAVKTMKINIAFSLAVKLVVVVLAFYSYVDLWMAVLADVGTSLVVVLFGMRLLHFGGNVNFIKQRWRAKKTPPTGNWRKRAARICCCTTGYCGGECGRSCGKGCGLDSVADNAADYEVMATVSQVGITSSRLLLATASDDGNYYMMKTSSLDAQDLSDVDEMLQEYKAHKSLMKECCCASGKCSSAKGIDTSSASTDQLESGCLNGSLASKKGAGSGKCCASSKCGSAKGIDTSSASINQVESGCLSGGSALKEGSGKCCASKDQTDSQEKPSQKGCCGSEECAAQKGNSAKGFSTSNVQSQKACCGSSGVKGCSIKGDEDNSLQTNQTKKGCCDSRKCTGATRSDQSSRQDGTSSTKTCCSSGKCSKNPGRKDAAGSDVTNGPGKGCCSSGKCTATAEKGTSGGCCSSGKCTATAKKSSSGGCCSSGKCTAIAEKGNSGGCCASGKCTATAEKSSSGGCCSSGKCASSAAKSSSSGCCKADQACRSQAKDVADNCKKDGCCSKGASNRSTAAAQASSKSSSCCASGRYNKGSPGQEDCASTAYATSQEPKSSC